MAPFFSPCLPAARLRTFHLFLPFGERWGAVVRMPLTGMGCRAGSSHPTSLLLPPPALTLSLDKDLKGSVPPSLPYDSATHDLSARTPVYFSPLLGIKCFSHSQGYAHAKRPCDVGTFRQQANTFEEEMLESNPIEFHLALGHLSGP